MFRSFKQKQKQKQKQKKKRKVSIILKLTQTYHWEKHGHFGWPVARGQRSAFFVYKKILYLIGLKYPIAFPFWSKIENSYKII